MCSDYKNLIIKKNIVHFLDKLQIKQSLKKINLNKNRFLHNNYTEKHINSNN